ncbi:MAG: hypothetical protein ACSHX9_06950 [Luteolibacter sp.]
MFAAEETEAKSPTLTKNEIVLASAKSSTLYIRSSGRFEPTQIQ